MRYFIALLAPLWGLGMGASVYFGDAAFAALCGMMFSLFTVYELRS